MATTNLPPVTTQDHQSYGCIIDTVCDLLSRVLDAAHAVFSWIFPGEAPIPFSERLVTQIDAAKADFNTLRPFNLQTSGFTRVTINYSGGIHTEDLHHYFDTFPSEQEFQDSFDNLKNRILTSVSRSICPSRGELESGTITFANYAIQKNGAQFNLFQKQTSSSFSYAQGLNNLELMNSIYAIEDIDCRTILARGLNAREGTLRSCQRA